MLTLLERCSWDGLGWGLRLSPLLHAATLFLMATTSLAGWPQIYDWGDWARPNGVATDREDNVIVTGTSVWSEDPQVWMYCTIKYSSEGDMRWVRTWPAAMHSVAYDVASDGSDNIIVAGAVRYYPEMEVYYNTIKYDSTGEYLWDRTWDPGAGGALYAAAADSEDNIAVVGWGFGGFWAENVIKYSPWGDTMWMRNVRYEAQGVAVDEEKNIIVTGSSPPTYPDYRHDKYYTVKYSPDGDSLWGRIYDSDDHECVRDVAVDTANSIVVTGYCSGDTGDYWLTIKYSPEGDTLWSRVHDTVGEDRAFGVATDRENNIIVVGYSSGRGHIIKYGPSGDTLWTLEGEVGKDVAVDRDNNIVVTGTVDDNYYTIKYTPEGEVYIGVEEREIVAMVRQEARLRVKPNPFCHYTAVANVAGKWIEVYDISGRLVEETRGNKIGLSLSSGVYFVKMGYHKPVKIVKILR